MTGSDLSETIRSLTALAGGIAGLWAILRMALRYQSDFTERYADRVERQDNRITALEAEITGLYRQVQECGQREARLRRALIEAGIEIPPDPGGEPPRKGEA